MLALMLLFAQDVDPEGVLTLAAIRRQSEEHCIRSSDGEITVCGRREGDRIVPIVNRWAPKPIRAQAKIGNTQVSTRGEQRLDAPALMTKLVIPF